MCSLIGPLKYERGLRGVLRVGLGVPSLGIREAILSTPSGTPGTIIGNLRRFFLNKI